MHSSYAAILTRVGRVSQHIILVMASFFYCSFQCSLPLENLLKERNAVGLYYSCTTSKITQVAKVLNVLPNRAGTPAGQCRTSPPLRRDRKGNVHQQPLKSVNKLHICFKNVKAFIDWMALECPRFKRHSKQEVVLKINNRFYISDLKK